VNKIIKLEDAEGNPFDLKVDNILFKKNFPKFYLKFKNDYSFTGETPDIQKISMMFFNHFKSTNNFILNILDENCEKNLSGTLKMLFDLGSKDVNKNCKTNDDDIINEPYFYLPKEVKIPNLEKNKILLKKIDNINEMISDFIKKMTTKFTIENLDKIFKKEPTIYIHLSNGKKQTIYNRSILKYNEYRCERFDYMSHNNHFVIVFIIKEKFKSSSIGIWDTRLNNWCFNKSLETEILSEKFFYNDNTDTFRFKSHHYSGNGKNIIDCEFEINKNRKIIWKEKSEITDDDTWNKMWEATQVT
jgi:hypothetical protein|tara:strand:- start:2040 stop:2945 length:906 start_codon:yes stop_codon:yes gene_type:complete